MKNEWLEMISVCPGEEEEPNNCADARVSAAKFIGLIQKTKPAPSGCTLKIKSNNHDFGEYITIEAYGEIDNQEHWDWVNWIQSIETWKEIGGEE